MSEEFDIFANSGRGERMTPPGGKKPYKKPYVPRRSPKQNNSPIRGSDGSESVNPLLNAPLPPEQKAAEPDASSNPKQENVTLRTHLHQPVHQMLHRGHRLCPLFRHYRNPLIREQIPVQPVHLFINDGDDTAVFGKKCAEFLAHFLEKTDKNNL